MPVMCQLTQWYAGCLTDRLHCSTQPKVDGMGEKVKENLGL